MKKVKKVSKEKVPRFMVLVDLPLQKEKDSPLFGFEELSNAKAFMIDALSVGARCHLYKKER